jgi:hypothetical protein
LGGVAVEGLCDVVAGPAGGVDAGGLDGVADGADMAAGENGGAGDEGGDGSLEVERSGLWDGCGGPRVCALVSTS